MPAADSVRREADGGAGGSSLVPDRNSATLDPACEDLLADLADDPGQIVAVAREPGIRAKIAVRSHDTGVDPVGIARALYYAVKERDLSSGPGGSTITQQLVKLTYLSPERTLSRKAKEAILAAEITADITTDYQCNTPDFPDEANLLKWGQSNVLLHAWPYWREFCHSTLSRMRLPVTLMPLVGMPPQDAPLPEKPGTTKRRRKKITS